VGRDGTSMFAKFDPIDESVYAEDDFTMMLRSEACDVSLPELRQAAC
jgi:hypothetical protein